MGTVVKLGGGGPNKDANRPPAKPADNSGQGGLAGIRLTPLVAAGLVAALLILSAGIWFSFGRASAGAASTPMMDTSSETFNIPPEQRANGMDTSTSSPASTTNNGMDTGTGQ